MDFFRHQDEARRRTRWLVLLFLAAVTAVVLAVNLVLVIFWEAGVEGGPLPAEAYLWISVGTVAVIAAGSLWRIFQLRGGGDAVAEMVGARLLDRSTDEPAERRLLNVVEEMAIASGTAVPNVYVMDDEPAINAFAAGYSPNEAVVAVTRGTLDQLNRDQLQGVIAHEFSHILHGDMRLNVRLMGLLNGILLVAQFGRGILRGTRGSSRSSRRGGGGPVILLGIALLVIGYVGVLFARVIQAGISRQREFLADASAVQYTRNPDGIAGALERIGGTSGAVVGNEHAYEMSHLYFGQAIEPSFFAGWFATHPPIDERIRRIRRVPHTARPLPHAAAAAMAPAGASGFAGGALPEAVAAAVGTIPEGAVDTAQATIAGWSAALREATRSADGARSLVYALLLASDANTRETQDNVLAGEGHRRDLAHALRADLDEAGRAARFPLLELALPALRRLSPKERARFSETMTRLIAADRRVTLDEFMIQTLLEHQLPAAAARRARAPRQRVDALRDEIGLALSLLAHAGGREPDAAREAHAAARTELGWTKMPELVPAARISLPGLRQALRRLNAVAPLAKPRILKACAATALADERLNADEYDWLRFLAATLDCPLPPLPAVG